MRAAIKIGKPSRLNRITDKRQIAKNIRDSGCPKLKKKTGKNCDEYPFASSSQGKMLYACFDHVLERKQYSRKPTEYSLANLHVRQKFTGMNQEKID